MTASGLTKDLMQKRSKWGAFFDGVGRALDLGFTQLPKIRRVRYVASFGTPASVEELRQKYGRLGSSRSSATSSADSAAFEHDWARVAADFARVAAPMRSSR